MLNIRNVLKNYYLNKQKSYFFVLKFLFVSNVFNGQIKFKFSALISKFFEMKWRHSDLTEKVEQRTELNSVDNQKLVKLTSLISYNTKTAI